MDKREFNANLRGESQEHKNIKFIHPKYLPNTKFILQKPKPLLVLFKAMTDSFKERYSFTDTAFNKLLCAAEDQLSNTFNENMDCNTSTIQLIIDNMHNYDFHYESAAKKRLYKAKKPMDILERFCNVFELFCARHFISFSVGSNWAFGDSNYYRLYKTKEITPRVKILDTAYQSMYQVDKEHVKLMGEVYEEWKRG